MFPIRTLCKPIRHPRIGLALAALATVGLTAPGARAAPLGHDATAVGMAQAVIVRPITVVSLADLDFGRIANAGTRAGSMTVALDGPGSVTASFAGDAHAACAPDQSCPRVHAAAFAVSGEPARAYSVSLPVNVVATATLAATGAAAPVVPMVDHLSVRTASRPTAGNTGQLDTGGADSFEIGGRLEVPAGVEPTDYRAVIQVVVTYL